MKKVSLWLMMVLLIAVVPNTLAQDEVMEGVDVIVTLEPTVRAEKAVLEMVTGWAHVVSDEGHIHISLTPNGAELPEGTVLEGWLVDAGLDGGPGTTNVSDADEVYGTPFGDAAFDEAVDAAPYALSTGVLTETEEGTWDVIFDIPDYNFSPYDAVAITTESDADGMEGFDPRPGGLMFIGLIAEGEPADSMMMDDGDMMGEDHDMMMGEATEVVLETTPLAANAELSDINGTAQVWIDNGTIEIMVNLNGATLPDGAVLEGWVVDAGLNGGPGTTNASDIDETFGTPFADPAFDDLVESAPYALSTGVLQPSMDVEGSLVLSFHVPAYNFSPYDAVVITLESDGNTTMGFDPRPGTPVLSGAIEMMMEG